MQNGPLLPDRTWLTAKEAACYLNIHVRTLYRYARRRRNPPPVIRFQAGGNYRFPKDKFIEWANGPTKKG